LIYLDTSFIAPYYVQEPSSEDVATVLGNLPPGQLAMSDWTGTEFASLLARRVRMAELGLEMARTIMTAFKEDARAFQLLEPSRDDFTLASNLLLQDPSLGLRSPDALHLAVAYNRHLELYSLDRKLIQAAQAFGIQATDAGINST
jgi:uncharacterized protein